jgi:hypothetical protein
MAKWEFQVDRLLRFCVERYITENVNSSPLSPMQQSYRFTLGKIKKSKLSHQIISLLYPLFEAIDENITSWLLSDSIPLTKVKFSPL